MYKVSIFLCAVYLVDRIQSTNSLENSYNIKPCNRRGRFDGNSPVSVNGPIVGTIQYPNPFLKPDSLSVNAKPELNSLKKNVIPDAYGNELQNNIFLKDTDDLSRHSDVNNINKNVDDFPVEGKTSLNDIILPEESKTGNLLNGNEDIQDISLRSVINPEDLSDDEKKCLDIEKRLADSNGNIHQNRRMSQGSQNDESDLVNTNNINQKSLNEPEYDPIFDERTGEVQATDRNAYDDLIAGTKGNRKNSDSVSSLRSPLRNQLLDPARGEGVSSMSESNVLLSQTSQLVCYACSTLSNPTCTSPDRKTTVKYCRKGHDACIKKTFQGPDSLITVRDCGSSCKDGPVSALELKYKTCQVCHNDLCNGAYTVQSISLIVILGIIGFSKYAV